MQPQHYIYLRISFMQNRRILWVDDDQDDLMLVRQVLQEVNTRYDIIEVNNGRAALDFLEGERTKKKLPALIILDMNMPVMNGRETLALIKSDPELKKIPVVVFTTSSSQMDKLFCKRFDVEMITKPPTYDKLSKAIQKMLSICDKEDA